MSDLNENQNGVFGGVQFGGVNKGIDYAEANRSFFENGAQGTKTNYGFTGLNQTTATNGTVEGEKHNGVYTNININPESTNNGNFETTNVGNYGTVNSGTNNQNGSWKNNFQTIGKEKAIAKQSLWSKIRAFLFKEINISPIKVELTPYQQKVEDEINEFLHQEVSFKNIAKLFSKKK